MSFPLTRKRKPNFLLWITKKAGILSPSPLEAKALTYVIYLDNSTPCYLYVDCFETNVSAAASGWTGLALAHAEFGSSVNPITTRGADYAHHITASPPGFENPAAALYCMYFT